MPYKVLEAEAHARGLNRDDLRNAARDLGIVTTCERDPRTGRQIRWIWTLPKPVSTNSLPALPNSAPPTELREEDGFYTYWDPLTGESRHTHVLGDEWFAAYQQGRVRPPRRADIRDREMRLSLFRQNFHPYFK